jgi:hypothetical protein
MRNVQVVLIRLNKHTYTMSNNDFNGMKLMILTFTHKTHFHELRNGVFFCRLQPNNDSKCEKLTRINLLRSTTYDFTRKIISFFYLKNRWNMILRRFKRDTCKWLRSIWSRPTFIVKNNNFNCTKLMVLTFIHKTHFHELWNTVYLCRLQPNYDSECKNITRINFVICNTHDFTIKKISFFYIPNRWNMIPRPFIWNTCKWFWFVWTSTYTLCQTMISITWSLWYWHLLIKRIFMSWEKLYNFVVYKQITIRNT